MPRTHIIPLTLLAAALAGCPSPRGPGGQPARDTASAAASAADPDAAAADSLNRTEGSYSARIGSPLAAFYQWWHRVANARPGTEPEPLPTGVSASRKPFPALSRLPAGAVPRPDGSAEMEAVELGRANGRRIALWAPTSGQRCPQEGTRVGVEPFDAWMTLNIRPNCHDDYGPEDVDVALYTVEGAEWPFIGIQTRGSSCMPWALLRFDAADGTYELYQAGCA